MSKYQELKAGDVRQEGDQQRQLRFDCTGFYLIPEAATLYSPWNNACLLGHSILASDLLHLQFRRPIK